MIRARRRLCRVFPGARWIVRRQILIEDAFDAAEIYEHGFVTTTWFGAVSARYGELTSIFSFCRQGQRRAQRPRSLRYTVRRKGALIREALGHDDKMAQPLGHACESLAGAWMKTLDRQKEAVWIMNGASPPLRIRKDGVVFQGKSGADEFIPLNEVRLKSRCAATVDICRGDAKRLVSIPPPRTTS